MKLPLRIPYKSPVFIAGALLLLLLMVSFGFHAFNAERQTRRTLFFPEKNLKNRTDTSRLSGETRLLPVRNSLAGNIRLLVDDIILGPALYSHERLFDQETRLISLLLDHGILYLNFSSAVLNRDDRFSLPLAVQIQALGNTLYFNFPGLTKIYVFIEGQIPDFRFLYGDELHNFSDGVHFEKGMFK